MAERTAVMVRIHGPDPKARKMRQHAFSSVHSGDTTLSASGVLLCLSNHNAVVVTCASIVEPFLSFKASEDHHNVQLVRGTVLQVLLAPHEPESKPMWLSAELLKLVNVSQASEALKTFFDVQGGSEGWEIGWALAHLNENQLGAELVAGTKAKDTIPVQASNNKEISLDGLVDTSASMAAASTRIAVLGLQTKTFDGRYEVMLSSSCKRGDTIRTVGSPFGALSPLHFFNSISAGVVSNGWPSSRSVIWMADIRCLPGMEGAPAFDEQGSFVGILLRPLRQRSSGAEVQLILPAEVLLSRLRDEGFQVLCCPGCSKELPANTNIQQAVSSVVLVTSNDGSWASGVLLNKTGLVLTNAHFLEPWRFRKPKADISTVSLETFSCSTSSPQGPIKLTSQHLRVCIQELSMRRSWVDAEAIFVSQGPLDVALLQLSSVPQNIEPMVVEPTKPVLGSTTFVIGHALFGPRAELGPSVTSGVVSRVIEAEEEVPPLKKCDPMMLQTTAAVHPGASGGAVVNAQGRLIGLVTSNTKDKERVIPHLNYSIPCAVLQPIFTFASFDTPDRQLLMEMNKHNRLLSEAWAVVPATPKSPALPWHHKDGVSKGSQFAKFIAESQQGDAKTKLFFRSSL